jgi:hypothetical protein
MLLYLTKGSTLALCPANTPLLLLLLQQQELLQQLLQ